MKININVTDLCNYQCSYFINKKITTNILDKDILSDFIDDIYSFNMDIYVFGIAVRQPLLDKNMTYLIERIDKIKCSDKLIWISTNGSLLPEKIDTLYDA